MNKCEIKVLKDQSTMTKIQSPVTLTEHLKQSLGRDEDILFAYLYGSALSDPALSGGDIDLAVYLKPSDTKEYIKREAELTAFLISQLDTDEIDLRILNVLPLVFQYSILKEGRLILSRDEMERADFETRVMIRFFELKPYLDEYRLMLSQRIRGAS
jgi:uncharacterized protein